MNFAELMDALSLETKLDLKGAKETGSCSVRFDDKVDVTMEADAEGVGVNLFAPLGVVPATERAALFQVLMQIHLLGLATDNAYFSFDEESQQALFFRSLRLVSLDRATALKDVESFVNQAMRWSAALPTLTQVNLQGGMVPGGAPPPLPPLSPSAALAQERAGALATMQAPAVAGAGAGTGAGTAKRSGGTGSTDSSAPFMMPV